ncbi:amidohydrolase family protein [Dissulfurirhabdus thermomarina]|uniref:Amidohydrolase family protein n=1 Tax=Dissulfurirhabdus thermomarina TaxID=1765737 RepID=A0A6N9TSU8_DISTH|nr:amidohydrolase family protein [Dissulfurirhabdus thermomarina]NDY41606.1 amidohydrolase family protein [Dissulfurirhabdus thermomarina]NMX23453.1 amidohydrolase family protein [Dissulfurirhabdus thermomarina]
MVDLHCHAAGIGAGGSGCFVSAALRRNWRFPVFLRAFGVTEGDLRREGDALLIRRLSERLAAARLVDAAVVLALDGVVGPDGALDRERTEIYVPNAFVARETTRFPNLLFGASINPYRADALERLDRAARQGAVLVKWLPDVQLIDPADPRLVPFYRRLRELGLPLLVHTGLERSFTRSRDDLGDPARLELPLREGVTVIAAHAAANGARGGRPYQETLFVLLARYPNLYADVSSLTQVNKRAGLFRLLRRPELFPRLVYGTDMPLIATPLVSPLFFAFRVGWRDLWAVLREPNPWDRDVRLKRALGFPGAVFTRSAEVLGLVRGADGRIEKKGRGEAPR